MIANDEEDLTLDTSSVSKEDESTHRNLQALAQVKREMALAEMRALAQQVAAAWISPKSGVELIAEQRR